MGILSDRISFLRKALDRPAPKFLVAVFALVGVYDTFVAQFLPPETAQKWPTVYAVFDMTSGYIPWWGWVIGAVVLVAIISIEYAFRRNLAGTKADKDMPLHVDDNYPSQNGPKPTVLYVPLIDAARRAYSETRGAWARTYAERGNASPEEILRIYALLIVSRLHVAVRGVRAPSDTDELIEWDSSHHYMVFENGGLRIKEHQGAGEYKNLLVRRGDMQRIIDGIAKWGGLSDPNEGEN